MVNETFDELLASTTQSAVHLEMRDAYTPDDPYYADWRAGERFDPEEHWRDWFDLLAGAVQRGVQVRRARIVSEPVTEYIRYEYDLTDGLNIASGEHVRWLPRRQASALALPGNDFWVFDGATVLFNYFAGDGSWAAREVTSDLAVAKLCATAFEAVWELAVDHAEYRPV